MAHYIPKSVVVAEIERRIKDILELVHPNNYDKAALQLYKGLLSFINTIEVKDVDLEKEITLMEEKYYGFESLSRSDIIEMIKHFFELGLKAAQKGEEA